MRAGVQFGAIQVDELLVADRVLTARRWWAAAVVVICGALVTLVVPSSASLDDADLGVPAALAMIGSGPLEELAAEALAAPVIRDDLRDGAADAVFGYWLVAGESTGGAWSVDLKGYPRAADRAAFGLMDLGLEFERSGDDFGVLSGNGAWTPEPAQTAAGAELQLAAITELTGHVTGRLALVGSAADGRIVSQLAATVGIDVEQEQVADGVAVWLRSRVGAQEVASWAYTCAERVPVVGGGACNGLARPVAVETFATLDRWLLGTTGSLVHGSEQLPVPSDGGVSWTNREAQQYTPEAVAVTSDGLRLTASPHPEPDVNRLPYDSGLVVSRQSYGYGRYEFDVTIPVGTGLWPAIWMLDTEACDAPGRCPRYSTDAYHEIDLIETAGGEVSFHSVHWFDQQIRSASVEQEIRAIGEGRSVLVGLDRRPGLLQWTVDGEVVATVTGPAVATSGIHRDQEMMIIINLAVGGSFSGDRILGRTASWWGDAKVPNAFPDLGWTEAHLVVHELRVTAL